MKFEFWWFFFIFTTLTWSCLYVMKMLKLVPLYKILCVKFYNCHFIFGMMMLLKFYVSQKDSTNKRMSYNVLDLPDGAGTHFTNDFSITIQMWWKFHFALIQILIKWSLQYLAHGTTAGLSWHVPNFVAMWSSVIELELNEISITFELWWKNR